MKPTRLIGLLSVVILILFGAFQLQAQNAFIGIKAGGNYTNLSGRDLASTTPRMGFVCGLEANFSFRHNMQLGVELFYNQRGAIITTKDISQPQNIQIDYLDFPVYLQVELANRQMQFRPKIFLGANFGLRIAAHNIEQEALQGSRNTDISADVKSMDYGAIGGVGFNLHLSRSVWMTMDVRYVYSFSNFYENPVLGQYAHRVMSANIGIGFDLIREY